MAEHMWSVLCKKVLIDPFTNQMSLIDVVERIQFTPSENDLKHKKAKLILGLPLAGIVVSMWRRSDVTTPEKFELRVTILLPDGENIASAEVLKMDLSGGVRMRAIMKMPQFPFRTDGVYRIIVQQRVSADAEWVAAGSVPIDVNQTPRGKGGEVKKAMATTKQRGRH